MMTLTEAARALGVAPSTLRHQIRLGKLSARKVSRDWYVLPEEVERYRRDSLREDSRLAAAINGPRPAA